MVKLTVTFLGTSSAAPTKGRGLPAIAIEREGEVVLMDCGEGVQRKILEMGIGLNRETTILITHLHGDHVTGLLGLLQTMGLAQRRKPVDLVGPAPLRKWLEVTADVLHMGLTFPVRFVQARRGVVLRSREFVVRAEPALHSVEAFSYLVSERDRPGVFYPLRARKLGVPEGKLWSRLQRGRKVVVGGKSVLSLQVTGPPRSGRKVGYSGDTRPSPRLSRFFHGCDLLIFDSTFSGKDAAKAIDRGHSTCIEAAETAQKAKARNLVLTHFSARYPTISSLVREARSVFPRTIAASDGLKLEIPYSAP